MNDDIFYLDWKTQKLFGWENHKSDEVIDSIIRGIEAGDDFPAVDVYKDEKNPDVFYISPFREIFEKPTDGGHNRAIGHYIADKPLKCRLYVEGSFAFDCPVFTHIEIPDIFIVDDTGEYDRRKKIFPNYR
jgi:hypothetical protein